MRQKLFQRADKGHLMKNIIELRAQLKQHKPSIGTWLQIPSPDVAEIIGCMGYDWAAVDMEHGAFSRSDLPNIFRALERRGTLPFVRVLEADRANIKLSLDSGAQGIIFPMITSRAQLDAAITAAMFPGGKEFALGTRGVGFSRSNLYGLDFEAHLHEGTGMSRYVILVAQIEHVDALHELDAIFSHPRLDAYMVGPFDLSASMGIAGDFTNSSFVSTLKSIEECATRHSLPKGFHVVEPNPETLEAKIAEGYSLLAYGIDTLFLLRGAASPVTTDKARPL